MSIFDLSPSEKLQLVEGLWDDLAAAPGCTAGKNGSWRGGKRTCWRIRIRGFSGTR